MCIPHELGKSERWRLVVSWVPLIDGWGFSFLGLPPAQHNKCGVNPRSTIYTTSVQFSRSVVSDSLQPHGLQHARLPCPLPTPGTCSNSCPSSQWCHPTISLHYLILSKLLRSKNKFSIALCFLRLTTINGSWNQFIGPTNMFLKQ